MKLLCALTMVALSLSCDREPSGSAAGPQSVTIYSSIDDPYLRPLLQRFEKDTGITVRIVTDTEATKSAALVQRLIAEKDRPQADVYWGNEIFHTINLAEQGLFEPYKPAIETPPPSGAGDLFCLIGERARVIAISTRPEHAQVVATIHQLDDLTDPALKGKLGICHPAFGTASGHVAAMYVAWGEERFIQYMKKLKANDIKLLGGNSAVAEQVAAGTLAAGLTDTDDVNNAKAEGQKIDGIVPDATLLIPSTVALLRNCPNPQPAKKLIDFLCDPKIERELIEKRYFAYSARDVGAIKSLDVDYVKAAHEMKRAVETALNILQERH